MDELDDLQGFQWDQGNAEKNWVAHGVTQAECERVLLGAPLIVNPDVLHSRQETRYYALGETDVGRRLFIVFTVRDRLVRVISARDMSFRERRAYEDASE